jgi:hypothetical protein
VSVAALLAPVDANATTSHALNSTNGFIRFIVLRGFSETRSGFFVAGGRNSSANQRVWSVTRVGSDDVVGGLKAGGSVEHLRQPPGSYKRFFRGSRLPIETFAITATG